MHISGRKGARGVKECFPQLGINVAFISQREYVERKSISYALVIFSVVHEVQYMNELRIYMVVLLSNLLSLFLIPPAAP